MSDTGTPITDEEITLLNAARDVLRKQSKHDTDANYRDVRAAVKAEDAEHAVFEFLSNVNAYTDRAMTYAQLHNTKSDPAPVPVPQSLRA